MEFFNQFIVDNFQLIISAIMCIVSVICCIVRKKGSSDLWQTILLKVVSMMPLFINEAEKLETPKAKRAFVIDCCIAEFEKILNRELNADEIINLTSTFGDHLENVLSTPQKKEV